MLSVESPMIYPVLDAKVINKSKMDYHPPRLQKYGKVVDLTAGGSGTASENSGPDPKKWRP